MRKVLVIQNVGCEPLGRFAEADADFAYIKPYTGEPVPHTLDGWDALIVLGGPMAVYEMEEKPFLRDELELLRVAIELDFPVLGICLGSQLIAAAAGVPVYAGPMKEIGWGKVQLTATASEDVLFSGLPTEVPVFQLHGDTFDLPEGAVLLATNAAYPNQAFRLGSRVYGVQFHIEVTDKLVEDWVSVYGDYLATGGVARETILSSLMVNSDELKPLAAHVIQRFLEL